ncbi:MAG: hypothetical protein H6584_02280 [Flavobacteriales bacterium]|nr:hypothetical protein [Flavobacteriales bacterium]
MIKNYGSLLWVALIGTLSGVIHYLLSVLFIDSETIISFTYPIYVLYAVFITASLIIVGTIIALHKKYKEQIGYVFLLLTSIKMGLSYVMTLPIIEKSEVSVKTEKINLFVVFILFLVIEVIHTIKVLQRTD